MTDTLEFKAMGCQMLAAIDYPHPRSARVLVRVPEWFETWEASLSRFRPESELSRLNRSALVVVPVSETIWSVMQASVTAEKRSDGLVTPTVLASLVSAGYNQSFERLTADHAPSMPRDRQVHPLQAVELHPKSRSIRLPAEVQLDFGGVAKGWAAHQAMKRLQSYGPALVDAGGDIAISGLRTAGEPWLVGIDDPLHPGESLGTLRLGRSGVATSGKDYRRWKRDGVWHHHIIDPRTGSPATTDVLTATVVAPTVLEAEMAAKVLLILGSKQGLEWLAARPKFAGMIITDDGQVLSGNSFEEHL